MKGKGSNNNYMAKHDQLYHLIECNDHGFHSKCGDNQTLKITGDHMIFQHNRPWYGSHGKLVTVHRTDVDVKMTSFQNSAARSDCLANRKQRLSALNIKLVVAS